ncbi:MAG TPA: prepilin-type N-terminal cleavage/methylation domain-containing protein [Myxococcales bacterium]|nr:prepilin-type N-terminal cleavage/methylation domain-containing protein [Myxococcales bacterium]
MRTARGFTLLEVMISLAILAISLVAISDLNGGAVQMHAYSRRATEATLLLRSKMLDVEDDLQKNGFSDFNDEKHGDFTEEGSADYAWSAEILKPDVQLDATQLLNLISGGSSNGGGAGGAGSALAGMLGGGGAPGQTGGPTTQQPGGGASSLTSGPLAGAVSGQMTTFIETLKKSVREIRLSVSWRDGKNANKVEASQIIVILPEMVGAAGQAAADAAAAAAAQAAPNGVPVPGSNTILPPSGPGLLPGTGASTTR